MSLTDSQDKGKSGWIYLIQCGRNYRLGFTKSPVEEKASALLKQGFAKVRLIGYFATNSGDEDEKHLVEKFSVYKIGYGLFSFPKLLIDCKEDWFKPCTWQLVDAPVFPKQEFNRPKTPYFSTSFHPWRNKRKPGYVYLFKCISSKKEGKLLEGAYKIGYTTYEVDARKKAVESEIQGKVEVIDYFWTEDPAREEVETHFAMQNFRVWKEWFDIPECMLKEDRRHLWFSSDDRGFLEIDSIDRDSIPVYEQGDFG